MNRVIDVEVIVGCEGPALYINGYRVAGPKPWGGGRTVYTFPVETADIDRAMEIMKPAGDRKKPGHEEGGKR